MLNSNASAELARRHLIDFVQYVKPGYDPNWHHKLLAEYLQKFIEGKIKRLMVFMPPQHGKSELVSRMLPAYTLGRNPDAKIVLASYSATLSESFSRDSQRYIESEEYGHTFKSTKLSGGRDGFICRDDYFEIVGHTGFVKAVGVGGSLTGTPADYVIIDDPVKDSIEAMSQTYQERNWNWFNDVVYTRIHNGSSILITQTRWDVNDLSGKLLKRMEEGGERWEVLNLPGIKTTESHPDDPRAIGEALWPQRHSLEKMEQVRSRSLRTFEALYQQNPRPVMAGGEFWKSFDPARHVSLVKYEKAPLHITVDNNVNPYVTVAIWQYIGGQARQIAELPCQTPNNNAPRAAGKLADWLDSMDYQDVVFLYGDPSASARSTIDENSRSFFDKFIDALRKRGYHIKSRVGKSAPEVAVSAAWINELYEQGRIVISEACPVSVEDYYTVKEDQNGGMLKVKKKDPNTGASYEPWGHFSDAKRYFLTELLADEFRRYMSKKKRIVIYGV